MACSARWPFLQTSILLYLSLCVQGLDLSGRIVHRADGLCATFVLPQGHYRCEEFEAQTDDGFLLGVQRMSTLAGADKAPVFLMHGILSGGDTWVLNPPLEALAFILADAGYDVWIGNFRTTDFSYGHLIYRRTDEEYWDWSVDELADRDLPTMLNLVHEKTGSKLHYIGFSQGTQAAFAAFSQGQLVDLVDKSIMMAPVAYISSVTTPIGVAAGRLRLDQVFGNLNFFYFTTKTRRGRQLVDLICAAANMQCFNDWITIFTGVNCCINDTRRSFYDKFETQATSTKNLQHLAQQLRGATFAKFDYGILVNLQRYGRESPPPYDLSKIPTKKMLLIHGQNDALSDIYDVNKLFSELPYGYSKMIIPTYAHVDFIVGTTAKSEVYDKMLKFLRDQ